MQHKIRLQAFIMSLLVTFFSLISIACAPSAIITSAVAPEPSSTAAPSATPTITPTPSPTPTPELSIEQKTLLLGINQNFEELIVANILVCNYKINNVDRVVFTYSYHEKVDGVWLQQHYNVLMASICSPSI